MFAVIHYAMDDPIPPTKWIGIWTPVPTITADCPGSAHSHAPAGFAMRMPRGISFAKRGMWCSLHTRTRDIVAK